MPHTPRLCLEGNCNEIKLGTTQAFLAAALLLCVWGGSYQRCMFSVLMSGGDRPLRVCECDFFNLVRVICVYQGTLDATPGQACACLLTCVTTIVHICLFRAASGARQISFYICTVRIGPQPTVCVQGESLSSTYMAWDGDAITRVFCRSWNWCLIAVG